MGPCFQAAQDGRIDSDVSFWSIIFLWVANDLIELIDTMKYIHVLYARADPAACKGKGRGRGPDPPLMFKIHTCKIYNLYSKPIFYMNYKICL
jgi:hypothetical protein